MFGLILIALTQFPLSDWGVNGQCLHNISNGTSGTTPAWGTCGGGVAGDVTDAQVPNNITIDLATTATTATALAANPADCSANQFATTIAANGALTCAQPAFSNLSGTATNAQIGVTTLQASGGTQSDAIIATYTPITGLSFTPAANTNYLIDCWIVYTSTAATTGINFAWDVPANMTSIHMDGHTKTVATGANEGFSQNSDNVGTSTSAAVITVQNLAVLRAIFRNGVTSDTMSLGFTPETANSVSVIGANSICQYRTF